MTMNSRLQLSRRALLKSAATASAAGLTFGSDSEARGFSLLPSPQAPPAQDVIPSFCEVCFWNCGLLAHVRQNRVLHLSGHPDYPNARGKLCGRD